MFGKLEAFWKLKMSEIIQLLIFFSQTSFHLEDKITTELKWQITK